MMFKKIGLTTIAVGMATLIFSFAQAADLDSDLGAQISFPPTLTSGAAPDFVFKPSPQVDMRGESDATGYAVGAAHHSALGKTDGKEYGMASDSNQVWWVDVSGEGTIIDVVGTNSAALSGAATAFVY